MSWKYFALGLVIAFGVSMIIVEKNILALSTLFWGLALGHELTKNFYVSMDIKKLGRTTAIYKYKYHNGRDAELRRESPDMLEWTAREKRDWMDRALADLGDQARVDVERVIDEEMQRIINKDGK